MQLHTHLVLWCCNTAWFPLKPIEPHQSIVDLFQRIAKERYTSETSSDSQYASDKDHFKNDVLFLLEDCTSVARAKDIHMYLRWTWFRRMMHLKDFEEARTRIVHLPSWVTPNICTAVLDSVMGEFEGELTDEEACTVLINGGELDLVNLEGEPYPPFSTLLAYCQAKVQIALESDLELR